MKKLILLALLLFPLPLGAETGVLDICNLGDMQNWVRCDNPDTGWDHVDAAISRLEANPDLCDVAIAPGDILDGYRWNKYTNIWHLDCWCLAQPDPAPEDCTIYTNPRTGRTCYETECNNTEATTCEGGTAGDWCEHTRAVGIFDRLEAVGIPVMKVIGNHDLDERINDCTGTVVDWERYFGEGTESAHWDQSGYFENWASCNGVPSGTVRQGDGSYHVLTVGGVQWLFLGFPWLAGTSGALPESTYSGTMDSTLEWSLGIAAKYPDAMIMTVNHAVLGEADGCNDSEAEFYENAWCTPWPGWEERHVGKTIYDFHMQRFKNLFFTIGSHSRDVAHFVSAETPFRVLGAIADYTDIVSEDYPAWQQNYNAGGGIVTHWRIDLKKNIISSKAYSAFQGEWLNVTGVQGSKWTVQMPLCSDKRRFNIPEGICPDNPVVFDSCCD